MEDELRDFRFELTYEHLDATDVTLRARLGAFVEDQVARADGACLTWGEDYLRMVRVIRGRGPAPAVTVLQALAMGHDVAAALDMVGAP